MEPLVVLLTNFELDIRGGSQLYVRDVALGLLRRGHRPVVYSPKLGAVARELADATVPVTDDLATITTAPDIVHGQHNHEMFAALLRFPGVPAVRICHGWRDDRPQPFPRVLRYVAVDETTRDRCVFEWGVPADRVDVLLNFVDTKRFASVRPLPSRPARALVFSNNAREHLPDIRAACRRAGVSLDGVGHGLGNATRQPESVLADYDIVFAKGRAALEALACGASVILCDASGLGPMVTSRELPALRRLNFGVRTLQETVSSANVLRQIERYDARDAREVTARVRAEASQEDAIDALVETYRNAIAEYRNAAGADGALPETAAAELRAASAYIQWLAPRVYWTTTPAATGYLLLRLIYDSIGRVPGLRAVRKTAGIRRLVSRFRNWRQRLDSKGPS